MKKAELNPSFRFAIYSIPATILFIWTGFTDPINLPKLLALSVLSLLSTVIFFASRQARNKKSFSKTDSAAIILYVTLAVAMSISGILGSDNWVRIVFGLPGRNNGVLYYIAIIVICLILLRTVLSRVHLVYVYKIITITASLFTLYCLLQFLNIELVQWSNPYNRIIGTLGNPNFSASALAIFAIFFLYIAIFIPHKKRGFKMGFFIFFVTAVLLSTATGSIQGIVVLGVGVLIIGFIKAKERITTSYFPIASLLMMIVLLVALFVSFLGFGPIGTSLEQYTLKLRGYYAYFGLKAMINSPLHGTGVDSYNQAFRMFRTEEFVNQYSVELNADNAHSTPAQIGATFGLVVFLLYLSLQFLVLFKSLKIVNRKDQHSLHIRGIALLWILVFSQSLLSIEIIGLGVLNWVLGALILSVRDYDLNNNLESHPREKVHKQSIQLPEWTWALVTFTLIVAMIPIGLMAREDNAYRNIYSLKMTNVEEEGWVKDQFGKLTSLTLLEPTKLLRILENLYNAKMFNEINQSIIEMYSANKRDSIAADLMSTHFRNIGEFKKEIRIREELRKMDPYNYKLELELSKAYAALKQVSKLRDSVSRIQAIAPESPELNEAKTLLSTLENR